MQSDIRDARNTLVNYLTGKRISYEDLDNAYELIKRVRPTCLCNLADAVKLTSEAPVECALCRESLAEFASMTAQQRRTEMPELLSHVQACAECRTRFRALREIWKDLADAAQGTVREMANAVHIVMDAGRRALQIDEESELVFSTLAPAAGVAMAGSGEGAKRQEWRIDDDDTGLSFLFSAFMNPATGSVVLQCRIIDGNEELVPAKDVSMALHNVESGDLLATGSLDDFMEDPIELSAGKWLIRIDCRIGDVPRQWRFAFNVDESGGAMSPQ